MSHRSARSRLRLVAVAAAFAGSAAGASSACIDAPSEPEAPAEVPRVEAPGAPPTPGGRGEDDGGTGRAPAVRAYDVNHVLGTGQSLSLGAMGTPPLSRSQPYDNLMFDTGLVGDDRTPTSFVPLVESATFMGEPVETPSSGMANLVAELARERGVAEHTLLVSLHGQSGASYPMIRKGTEAYARGLAQVRAAKAIAESRGESHVVRAITVVHGESDGWQNWNDQYAGALLEWQRDYEADIQQITGQAEGVPMFHSQYSAWTSVEQTPDSVIPTQQLEAHVAAPGEVVLVGPRYPFPYARDGLHLTNEGYEWLGEYYAKAYTRQVLEGRRWEPLRPLDITRTGTQIVARFAVPSPPLVLDTEHVTDPGDLGFEVVDGGGARVGIRTIEVTAPDTVTLTVDGAASSELRLRYAYTGTPGQVGGPATGPRGNLRDSDPTRSRSGRPLHNWCVHFDEPVR